MQLLLMRHYWRQFVVIAAAALPLAFFTDSARGLDTDRIRPDDANPFYWQYKGEPVLLLGGSWQDNLFNHPTLLEEHLDLLVSVGGNYARNTMSSRNRDNVFAHEQTEEGLYDLDRFHEPYWDRFENFLRLTHERDIIVQIEVWDPHDFYADREPRGGWSKHPFNPVNNVNYTAEDTGLPTEISYRVAPQPSPHAFFRTVPALNNNERVLAYQTAYVNRMLEHSLPYPHVIYCMNNEIGELTEWGDFWARHIQRRASEAGVSVYTADMRRDHNIRTDDHNHIYDQPELYTFVDISQVTGGRGQRHYDDVIYVRNRIGDHPRPINNVKNYGAAKHGEEESVARMCRFIFAGGASSRFHRPHPIEDAAEHARAMHWGLGLSPRAQTTIRAMRKFDQAFGVFRSAPRNDLLSNRDDNEAYLLAVPGEQYAVYFPDGGAVTLDVSEVVGDMTVRRLDVDTAQWRDEGAASGGGILSVVAPAPADASISDNAHARENLVVNGSFEADPLPDTPGYTSTITGWTVCGVHGHLLNDENGPFYTAALGPIPDGEQVYGSQHAGVLSQKLRRLQDGRPFSFSCRVNCRWENEGMDLEVALGDYVLWSGTVTPQADDFLTIEYEGVFDAAWGDALTFTFENPHGDATLLLDDVQLYSAPGFGKHSIVVLAAQ